MENAAIQHARTGQVSENAVAALMREQHLAVRRRRRRHGTTRPDHQPNALTKLAAPSEDPFWELFSRLNARWGSFGAG